MNKMYALTTDNGFYGDFGGAFIPEMLYPNVRELEDNYREILADPEYGRELSVLLKKFVGRPTPLFHARRLSEALGTKILLKREDLCHTGAHKINNSIGQILIARRLNKHRIIAETGAGQHGVATATACALMGMECTIYMGEKDMQRQAPNVSRMKMLGAVIVPVTSGSCTLKDATNEAIRDWIDHPTDTHYIIGSAVGPHPYPDLVARLQSVISEEIVQQVDEKPGAVIACVGGGSNAIGAFYHYLEDESVKLYGVEASGCGINSGKTAATLSIGTKGVLHAAMTYVLQDADGQVVEPHSISAGLDYPGVGPQHASLHESGRVKYISATDEEAIDAAFQLARLEGIIPALETAHALAGLNKINTREFNSIVVCLSGRGDKDMQIFETHLNQ